MIVINYKTYSPEYIKRAIELAQFAGIEDTAEGSGKPSMTREGLSVSTGKGEMVAYASYEGLNTPGICIDLATSNGSIGLVTSDVDSSRDSHSVRSYVFADSDDDNYSDEIFHYGGCLGCEKVC